MAEASGEETFTVGYWSIRGLGAPLRAMVMYANKPLNNVMYDLKIHEDGSVDASAWFDKKPALKEKNALINLPYVIHKGRVITQSNACFMYLGRELGLWGSNEDESIDCEQLLCEIMDLRNTIVEFSYGDKEFHGDKAIQCVHKVQGKNGALQKLELWLEQKITKAVANGENADVHGSFLVGTKATAPDFHLYEMLVQFSALADKVALPPLLENFPRLKYFYAAHGSLPGNQRYLSSLGCAHPLKIPFNQKMAPFGGALDCGKWVPGTKYDFDSLQGIF